MQTILKLAKDNLGFLILVAIIGGLYLFMRTQADDLESADEFTALLGKGRPVLVELFSNT